MSIKEILIKEWIESIVIAIVITGILYFVVWPMKVDGKSMEDTLNDKDYILVSRLMILLNEPKRGDIVTLEIKEGNKKEKVVKRIVAIEGDHMEIEDGIVTINSKQLEERYIKGETIGEIDIHVPKDGFFVLGDNRTISKDSRYFGCIYKKNIKSKVILKLF